MDSDTLPGALAETLAVFEDARPGTPLTTSEVTAGLDVGRRSTYDRLERLAERGHVETKEVGARGRVWWRPLPPGATGAEDAPAQGTTRGGAGSSAAASRDGRSAAAASRDGRSADGESSGRSRRGGGPSDHGRDGPDGGRSEDGQAVGPADGGPLGGDREFRSLVAAVEEYAIFVLDPAGRVRTWNDGAREIKGYASDEILGEHFSTFYTEEDREAGVPGRNLERAAERDSVEDEGWRVREDGSRFWANVTITAIRDDDGDLVGYTKVTRDMTERREREQALERQNTLVEQILEISPVGIAVLEADGTLGPVNSRGWDLLGVSDDDATAFLDGERDLRDERGAARYEATEPAFEALEAGEPVYDREVRIETDDGSWWLSINATPITGEDGVVERVVATADDVTQLKAQARRLERQRDELESELDDVFERVDDAFYALDDEFRFTYVNERAEELLRAEEAELLGESVWEMFPDARETPAWAAFHDALETQEQAGYETYFDPLGIWVEARVYPSESGLSVYFRDVTERTERERELERYETIVETVDDGVYVLDEEFRFVTVNDAYVEMTGYDREELVGAPATLVVDEDVSEESLQQVEAMDAGERTSAAIEADIHRADGSTVRAESKFSALPSADGEQPWKVGVVRDLTERKERERQLERYETIVETMDEGVYVVDEEGVFTWVNRAYVEMTGYPEDELVGGHVSMVVDEETVDTARAEEAKLRAGEGQADVVDADLQTADGGSFPAAATFAMLPTDDGERRRVGVVRDITERKERERQLERFERMVETVDDGVYATDGEGTIVFVNDALVAMSEHSRETLLGAHGSAFFGDSFVDTDEAEWRQLVDGERDAVEFETDVVGPDGEPRVVHNQFVPLQLGEEIGRVGVTRDVTERKERERELQRRVRQQEVVTELGQQALVARDLDDLMQEASRLVAETLDTDCCKVLELQPETDELLLREGVGWDDGVVGSATVAADENSQAGYTLRSEAPVIVADLDAETRFSGPDLLTDHGVESGISVVVGSPSEPWGILGTHATEPRQYDPQDASFVQSVANVLATAIDRRRYERRLERRRRELEALDDLNGVVQGITEAVIEQSTREEVERKVCERLAASDSYEFAWIGDVDAATETVQLRAEAGVEGYLDDVDISVDPDDDRSRGPTGRAVLTEEPQVTRDVLSDPDYERWREAAREHGFRSSVAIPVLHEETLYGVLNVYASEPHAFSDEELAVVGQLGEVVGHAIASIERKRALMSDEVVELQFRVTDLFEALDVEADAEGTITIDQTVPVGDGTYLVYGTVTDDGRDALDALAEGLPHWEAPSMLDGDESEGGRFELRLTEPPVLSMLAAHGGNVQRARIEDGDYDMTIHLPPSVDVRRVIDAVEDAYPSVEMVAQRQETRRAAADRPLDRVIEEELTDRQHAAMEAALHAGYFEWPRDSSGEDVAESLGISAPTFHQHLRNAQRVLVQSALDPSHP